MYGIATTSTTIAMVVEGLWGYENLLEKWWTEPDRPRAIVDVVRTMIRNIRGISGCISSRCYTQLVEYPKAFMPLSYLNTFQYRSLPLFVVQ
jgi:hypothetical protein